MRLLVVAGVRAVVAAAEATAMSVEEGVMCGVAGGERGECGVDWGGERHDC